MARLSNLKARLTRVPIRPQFPAGIRTMTKTRMITMRTRWSAGLIGLAAMLAGASLAGAQAPNYPQRPIKLIVPFAAGGNTDIIGRLIAPPMSDALGQQVVVENKAGAGTVVGSEAAAHAAPDGYTILLTTIAHAVNPALYKK